MEITFSIRYKAEWGQSLCIAGSCPSGGQWAEDETALTMHSMGEDLWGITMKVSSLRGGLRYYYFVRDQHGQTLRREWRPLHYIEPAEEGEHVAVYDIWIDRGADAPFYSSAFADVLYQHPITQGTRQGKSSLSNSISLQVYAPLVAPDQALYLSGSAIALGEWSPEHALALQHIGGGLWQITLPKAELEGEAYGIEYKFFTAGTDREPTQWDEGDNRRLELGRYADGRQVIIHCPAFRHGTAQPRHAGVVLPLFSMRHRGDWGVGDFGSLRKMIDWAHSASLSVLQLLPINDTTFFRDWRDSYPYNAISVDALHPIYIDIQALPRLTDAEAEAQFAQRAEALSQLEQVDYPEVMTLKEAYLRLHYAEHGQSVCRRKAFRHFCQQNEAWLEPYVAYCLLRDLHPQLPPHSWGAYSQYQEAEIQALLQERKHRGQAQYHRYVQYLLHSQLVEASGYARSKGVVLKGDIAIGVSPHGCDVWHRPDLYHSEQSAGAPPDAFATDGQNWGFPTYHWSQMLSEGLQWWRRRLHGMAQYFQAFRIDHILGFFRIWEIPRTQRSGLLGHFSPALPMHQQYWTEQLGSIGSVEELARPYIYLADAEAIFGTNLFQLIQQGHLQPDPKSEGYYLAHLHAQAWEGIPEGDIAGGAESKAQLIHLCREVALLADPRAEGYYHPRIAFDLSLRFRHWSPEAQERYRGIAHHYFYEKHNELYKQTALGRLASLVSSTEMLVCAEDLGMIPASVPEVLSQLQILSLDLERMPKASDAGPWYSPQSFPYLSVCTTSTHDIPPLRLWWQGLGHEQRQSYLDELSKHSAAIDTAGADQTALLRSIVQAHLAAPSMLSILPLSDWMSIHPALHLHTPEQEQINQPADPQHKWSYRMPITIEELGAEHTEWVQQIRQMIHATNRQ